MQFFFIMVSKFRVKLKPFACANPLKIKHSLLAMHSIHCKKKYGLGAFQLNDLSKKKSLNVRATKVAFLCTSYLLFVIFCVFCNNLMWLKTCNWVAWPFVRLTFPLNYNAICFENCGSLQSKSELLSNYVPVHFLNFDVRCYPARSLNLQFCI